MQTQIENSTQTCLFKKLFLCKTRNKIILGVLLLGGIASFLLLKKESSPILDEEKVDEFVIKQDFKDRTFGNLDIYGTGSCENVTVHGPTNVYGKFTAKNSHFSDAAIYGALTTQDTQFREVSAYGATKLTNCQFYNLEVYGTLKTKTVQIEQDLMITGACYLDDTTVNLCQFMGQDIYIQKTTMKTLKVTNSEKKKITVHVSKSMIDKVIFDNVEGKVSVYDEDSKIGAIEGGQLKHTKAIFVPKVMGE